jgi:predicted translin family RNA/ssDNA-binding protein
MTEDEPQSQDKTDRARAQRAVARGREKLVEVQRLLSSIREEVTGDRFWRYQRNVSPGLQEYIEALSFIHYLDTGKLISFDDVQRTLSDEGGVPVRKYHIVLRCSMITMMTRDAVFPSAP